MTTIAWDGFELAADRLCSNMHRMTACKLYPVASDGSVLAGVGNQQLVLAAVAHLRDGAPKPTTDKDDGFKLLRVYPNGRAEIHEHQLLPMPVNRECIAIGSGQDYAMMAMFLGLSARQAVLAAAEFDEHTGTEVDVRSLVARPPKE